MDWTAVIDRHRDALRRVLAVLVGMAGLEALPTSLLRGSAGRARHVARPNAASGGGCSTSNTPTRWLGSHRPPLKGEVEPQRFTLPRHLHRAILRLLRPAEAAARRLIIVAARNLAPPPALPATSPFLRPLDKLGAQDRASRRAASGGGEKAVRPLPLTDPLSRWRPFARPFGPRATGIPRISVPGVTTPHPVPLPRSPDDPVDAMRLARRLAAVAAVLDDLPHHARRFLRWQARNQAAIRDWQAGMTGRFRRFSALRPGRPPGHPPARQRGAPHEVHDLLADLQYFGREALEPPDTS